MNTIIKQIHSEFSEAEAQLIKEVEAILLQTSKIDENKVARLASLGFSQFKELKAIDPKEIQRVDTLKKQVTEYSSLSNLYKFITEDKVTSICKKWGLVHSPINLYKDSIPVDNQLSILDFDDWIKNYSKVLERTFISKHNVSNSSSEELINNLFGRHDADTHASILSELISRNIIDVEYLRLWLQNDNNLIMNFTGLNPRNIQARICKYERSFFATTQITKVEGYLPDLNHPELLVNAAKQVLGLDRYGKVEYTIIAAEHMLNMKDQFITEDYKVRPIVKDLVLPEVELFKDDDPIVLAKVKGGYLIVTAWGDEASDPDVVNNNMN